MDRHDVERDGEPPSPAAAATAGRLAVRATLALAVLVVLGVQVWLAARDAQRTAELRGALSESHSIASRLERRIGYGGLIHDFKNYVLRPDEDRYRRDAHENARRALAHLERLNANAAEFGIDARLERTREMIESYAARLERVRELASNGRDPGFIDERVRFDDAPALEEVEHLLETLDASVDARLAELERHGAFAAVLGTAGTVGLVALFVGVSARRRRRHVASMRALNAELTASNAELARANVSLGQFAGIVSHDLKTPLRHIELASSMMVEDADDPAALGECADILGRSVVRMDGIIDSLLDFTKTGFALPRSEELDVRDLLERLRAELAAEPAADGASIELDVALEPGTRVRADPGLLGRVFSNLVGNSLKYARDGVPARVLVRAELADGTGPDAGGITFSVADEGIGIEPRFAAKIFEPLERLHGPGRYEGVGIGLSLARSIVEGHGGRIWLDAERVGGARIAFSLPAARAIFPVERRRAA